MISISSPCTGLDYFQDAVTITGFSTICFGKSITIKEVKPMNIPNNPPKVPNSITFGLPARCCYNRRKQKKTFGVVDTMIKLLTCKDNLSEFLNADQMYNGTFTYLD